MSNLWGERTLHADEVANFLSQNKEFFHIFPELLDDMSAPHPKTGEAVSLVTRQITKLREERDRLQVEVDTLTNTAGENGKLLQKVYEFSYRLMAARTEAEAVDRIYQSMEEIFQVEQISLMSWDVPNQATKGINQLGISQTWSEGLKLVTKPEKPICGFVQDDWQKGLFSTADLMESVCLIPLGKNKVWGVLALGSTSDRFSPDLGTYFLNIMGNLISARLERLFENDPRRDSGNRLVRIYTDQ